MATKPQKPSSNPRAESAGKAGEKRPLTPPEGGAAVRMYRIGHGDCFLIAFHSGGPRPIFVMIDCGYKPGSPDFINPKLKKRADMVAADIMSTTDGQVDVGVITHEHQDHLNGITRARYQQLKIGEVWLAWTESDSDELAKRLRRKHGDTLKALVAASARLAAADPELAAMVNELVALEIGGEGMTVSAGSALAATGSWTNKDALQFFRERSLVPPRIIYPHREIITLPGAAKVRIFALGPPYDEDAIGDLNPRKGEGFPQGRSGGHGAPPTLAAALASSPKGSGQPFSPRHSLPLAKLGRESRIRRWYLDHYGEHEVSRKSEDTVELEVTDNAPFRRIDDEWLFSAEHLALAMGNDTNNSSLVLAFELGKGGKVLLFAGDAQRGNWASWADRPFKDGDHEIDVKELLGRTVLYKVGHHGSHNATLTGTVSDQHPNLAWLGRGKYGGEFTAMITAVREWATQESVGWDHPLPSIKAALLEKCAGQVLQTDTAIAVDPPKESKQSTWTAFRSRANDDSPLYFDYLISGD